MNKCRVCGHKFFEGPLIRYENMPRAAQFLPDTASLEGDKGVVLEVCQCSGCGLVQLSNAPVPYYKDVIRSAAFSEEMKDFRRKQFESFVQKYFLKRRKIIEIGCGRGEYLSIMQQCDVEAYGLEHSEESVKECIKHGLKVSKGFVENSACDINDTPFEAFFMLNFLEHLPDPNSILRGIYKNLTDSAIGFVEVPNFDMILRNNLFSEFIGDHLLYFTKETLITALNLNGFDVIDCQEIWHDYIISAVVRKNPVTLGEIKSPGKREKLDISSFHKYQARLKNELDEYLGRFGSKNVAIWGAGHQALAVMALTDLTGKIKYVIDSAPFKQGKYTPATHIPIVSPDMLSSDPVEAIIVMAGGYSEEVVKLLKEKFGNNVDIVVLRDFSLEII